MSRFLMGIQLNDWILIVTPLFFTSFVGLCFWVYRQAGHAHYQRIARLPLEEDGGCHVAK